MRWLEQAWQDLRFALRGLAQQRTFATVAILILGLGVGTATAIFSVINAVLLKPLAYDQPGQLVEAFEVQRSSPGFVWRGGQNPVSPGVFFDWRNQATLFEGFAAYSGVSMNLTDGGEPVQLSGLRFSANGLQLLRARPVLGRIFAPDEDQLGKDKVVVLTYGLWQSRFGGTADAIGRSISLNDERYTIIGILPANFLPAESTQFVIPYSYTPAWAQIRGGHFLTVYARLKAGVTVEQGRAELAAIARTQKPLYPLWKKNWTASIEPMAEQMTRDSKPSLLILLCAVSGLFVIACANVANLLLARGAAREKEIALRMALGAGRGRIIRQLLIESALLSFLGGLLGIGAALWGIGALRHLAGAMHFPRVNEIALDSSVLAWALGGALLTGVVFGLAPALQASRPDLNRVLKSGTRGSQGGGARLRRGLIVLEMGLSLVLLAGAGLLLRSFMLLARVPPGFNPEHALVMQVSLSDARYPDNGKRADFYERIAERLEQLPGVTAAGLIDYSPLAAGADRFVRIPGWPGDHDPGLDADLHPCTPDYFHAAGVPLLRGRAFQPGDLAQHRHVALINETMARTCFGGSDPVGRKISYGPNSDWVVVGVMGDVHSHGLSELVRPAVFLPASLETWNSAVLVIRTAGDPLLLAEPARKAILGLDPAQPVSGIRTLASDVGYSLIQRRLTLSLLGFFALSALFLAGVGLYGVIAYAVTQRTREFGIRSALGANPGNLLGLVLRSALALAGSGLAVGIGVFWGLSRLLGNLLYGIKPTDPLTLAGVSLLLLAVAALASWLPARRAAKVEPIIALRAE